LSLRKGVNKMKKIVITIKEKENENCDVNVKIEDNKSASTNEKMTASNVYNAILNTLTELSRIK
jgi:hypothetical protein